MLLSSFFTPSRAFACSKPPGRFFIRHRSWGDPAGGSLKPPELAGRNPLCGRPIPEPAVHSPGVDGWDHQLAGLLAEYGEDGS